MKINNITTNKGQQQQTHTKITTHKQTKQTQTTDITWGNNRHIYINNNEHEQTTETNHIKTQIINE